MTWGGWTLLVRAVIFIGHLTLIDLREKGCSLRMGMLPARFVLRLVRRCKQGVILTVSASLTGFDHAFSGEASAPRKRILLHTLARQRGSCFVPLIRSGWSILKSLLRRVCKRTDIRQPTSENGTSEIRIGIRNFRVLPRTVVAVIMVSPLLSLILSINPSIKTSRSAKGSTISPVVIPVSISPTAKLMRRRN